MNESTQNERRMTTQNSSTSQSCWTTFSDMMEIPLSHCTCHLVRLSARLQQQCKGTECEAREEVSNVIFSHKPPTIKVLL
jgi:hypothetical protein